MRISTSYQFDTYSRGVASAQNRVFEAERLMVTGKRINTMSDDPFGGTMVLSARSLKSATEQYKSNLESAVGTLGTSEVYLGEGYDLMRRAYELAVRGANGTVDQTAREAMAREVGELQRRLLDLANSRGPAGQYLFAGRDNGTKPFTLSGTSLTYNGDNLDVLVESSPTETIPINTQGDPLFTDAYNALENLKTSLGGGSVGTISGVDIPAMQASMKSLNQARGVAGIRTQEVNRMIGDHTRRIDEFTKSISDTEDVDLSEAVVKYRLAQTAYEAALNVAGSGYKLSLMDFMR